MELLALENVVVVKHVVLVFMGNVLQMERLHVKHHARMDLVVMQYQEESLLLVVVMMVIVHVVMIHACVKVENVLVN